MPFLNLNTFLISLLKGKHIKVLIYSAAFQSKVLQSYQDFRGML